MPRDPSLPLTPEQQGERDACRWALARLELCLTEARRGAAWPGQGEDDRRFTAARLATLLRLEGWLRGKVPAEEGL